MIEMVTLKILGYRGVENREIEDLRIGKKQLQKRLIFDLIALL